MILYVWHHCAWKITKLPRLTLCFSLLFLKTERWEGYHQRMPLHRGRPAGIRRCLLRPVRCGHQRGVVCPLVREPPGQMPREGLEASVPGTARIQEHFRLELTKSSEERRRLG